MVTMLVTKQLQKPNSLGEEDFLDNEVTSVFKDLKDWLANDTSELKLGVMKFCQQYGMMNKEKFKYSFCVPVFGGNVTRIKGGLLRQGRRVAAQATAAGRRQKTLKTEDTKSRQIQSFTWSTTKETR